MLLVKRVLAEWPFSYRVGRVETGAVMVGAPARVGETSEVDHRVGSILCCLI
jgi:hypothetical protein